MANEKVNPELKHLLFPISKLKLDPNNARVHGEENMLAIVDALKTFGQQKPILVDKKGIVRAGNGRLEAAKILGWTQIAVLRLPFDGEKALREFAILDNRTGELSTWKIEQLAAEFKSIPIADLKSLGWSQESVDFILRQAEADEQLKGFKYDLGDEANQEPGEGIKQIILNIPRTQHKKFLEGLTAYAKAKKVESFSEAVLKLTQERK